MITGNTEYTTTSNPLRRATLDSGSSPLLGVALHDCSFSPTGWSSPTPSSSSLPRHRVRCGSLPIHLSPSAVPAGLGPCPFLCLLPSLNLVPGWGVSVSVLVGLSLSSSAGTRHSHRGGGGSLPQLPLPSPYPSSCVGTSRWDGPLSYSGCT